MKKAGNSFTLLVFLFLLSWGCGPAENTHKKEPQLPDGPPSIPQNEDIKTAVPNVFHLKTEPLEQEFTIRIEGTVNPEQENSFQVRTLRFFQMEEEIQVEEGLNIWAVAYLNEIYIEALDLNFDGINDFWIKDKSLSEFEPHYHAWIWDVYTGRFRKIPDFEQITRPVIDLERRIIHDFEDGEWKWEADELVLSFN